MRLLALVLEDEKGKCALIERQIGRDFECIFVQTQEEALDVAKKHGQNIHIAILDIFLNDKDLIKVQDNPELATNESFLNETGLGIAMELTNVCKIPVAVLSLYSEENTVHMAKALELQIPVDHFFTKEVLSNTTKGQIFLARLHSIIRNHYSTDRFHEEFSKLERTVSIRTDNRKIGIRTGKPSGEAGASVYHFLKPSQILMVCSIPGKGRTEIHVELDGEIKKYEMGINVGQVARQIEELYDQFSKIVKGVYINHTRILKLVDNVLFFDTNKPFKIDIGSAGKTSLAAQYFLLRAAK